LQGLQAGSAPNSVPAGSACSLSKGYAQTSEHFMTDPSIDRIVVVGGGSAGWLTAAVLAAAHPTRAGQPARVTLVESPEVAPLGVGEGTWPTMRDTLRRIGVSEADFLRECDASFKQGSRFMRWVDGTAADAYDHPFALPHGQGEANLYAAWVRGQHGAHYAEAVSFQPAVCAAGKAPKQAGTPEFAAVSNYGYHLDAGRFGTFLRSHCVNRLQVRHVQAHVLGVHAHENGDIRAVATDSHGDIAGELFIDCSGSRSLLLGQHYGVALKSMKHVLFNDTALAVQLPYPNPQAPVATQTLSTAQTAGWIWDIGLPTRRGIGHVYSSAHASEDSVAQALQQYLAQHGGGAAGRETQDLAFRKLQFEPGYREHFWHRNCVAVGQAAGFIEPLEASALVMAELAAAMLADCLPATRAEMEVVARQFNEAFTYRWQRIIDFLKLHYVLSRRRDSDYWRDNQSAASMPERLTELLTVWRHRQPSRYDLNRIEEVFPAASYEYILYGMGFKPALSPQATSPSELALAERYLQETAQRTRKLLAGLPGNRELLDHFRRPVPQGL